MKQPTSSFAKALRMARHARGVSQEEFDTISSRTYISALERGIKQPTITKVDALAAVLGLHPLTLLALSYADKHTGVEMKRLLDLVQAQLEELSQANQPVPVKVAAEKTRKL
jgi:transcriptional regulator with XRE-family HTH domain